MYVGIKDMGGTYCGFESDPVTLIRVLLNCVF